MPVPPHGGRLRQGRSGSRASSSSSPSRRNRPSTSTISTWRAASPSCGRSASREHFKFNIETNHATLAGHTFQHEIEVAAAQGLLGSIDANTGDLLLGWDTDQFNTDVKELVLAMISILRAGGLGTGGINFDAKLRRPSIDLEDLFHAHIGGIDAYALAYKIARRIIGEGEFDEFVAERYSSYDSGYGRDIEKRQDRLRGAREARALEARRAQGAERAPGIPRKPPEPVP